MVVNAVVSQLETADGVEFLDEVHLGKIYKASLSSIRLATWYDKELKKHTTRITISVTGYGHVGDMPLELLRLEP